jgi:glycosyltransferase involved in cell wall biosynthesis
MIMNGSLQILMATFNGRRFLARQLDSILAQSVANWTLLIRDDGSTDGTAEIIRNYQHVHAGKITIIEDGLGNLGPKGNFVKLLESADADYIMFSDQDDVWLPDKIELSISGMKKLEQAKGNALPLLVHTDLVVADGNLRPIADSLWKFQKMDPRRGNRIERIFIENVATGCTVLINRKLRDMALPIPPAAIMHDWWLALVAAAFGSISHLPDRTVLYRQHDTNEVGAQSWDLSYLVRKLTQFFDGEQLKENLSRTGRQAAAFFERFRYQLDDDKKEKAAAYAGLGELGMLRKRFTLLRHGFFRTGLARNVSLFLRM